jgi:hypothetical protein
LRLGLCRRRKKAGKKANGLYFLAPWFVADIRVHAICFFTCTAEATDPNTTPIQIDQHEQVLSAPDKNDKNDKTRGISRAHIDRGKTQPITGMGLALPCALPRPVCCALPARAGLPETKKPHSTATQVASQYPPVSAAANHALCRRRKKAGKKANGLYFLAPWFVADIYAICFFTVDLDLVITVDLQLPGRTGGAKTRGP